MNPEHRKALVRRARTIKGVPTALALFSGGGGLDLGFKFAGFKILAATDSDPYAAKTHAINWPGVPFILKDIRTLSVTEILEATSGRRPDVIIGGPPCEGFSTLGARLSADPRNLLVDSFVRIADALRPGAVVAIGTERLQNEAPGHGDAGIAIALAYTIGATQSVTFTIPRAWLSKPKRPISGPGGVEVTYDYQGSYDGTALCALSVVLKNQNDGTAY